VKLGNIKPNFVKLSIVKLTVVMLITMLSAFTTNVMVLSK